MKIMMMILDVYGYWMRHRHGFFHGNVDRVRLRNRHRVRNRDRYFDGHLNRIRHRFFYRVGDRTIHVDGIRLSDMYGIRPIYRHWNGHLHRYRHVLNDMHWVWLRYAYGHLLVYGHSFDVRLPYDMAMAVSVAV